MNTAFSYMRVALLLGVASLALMPAAFAQTNNGQAPILPQPPASALQPISNQPPAGQTAASTTVTTTTTPVTKLDGSAATAQTTTTAATTTSANGQTPAAVPTTVTAALPPAPTAQAMGGQQATTVTTATTTMPANGFVTGNTAQPAAMPIALPGMPSNENALAANTAATTIDPNLVGAGNAQTFDQAAYDEQLKQRLAELKVETRQKALERATQSTFPMQPSEIEDVIRQLRRTQAAIQKPIEQPPATPRAVVHTMELDPGAQPPTIQMLNGNVTSLTILDATGQPWPVVDIAFGGAFDVKPPEAGGHIIRISPLKEYARGNMSIRLQKLAMPLTFTLDAGGKEVHYRFDARVPMLGPNAKSPLIDRGIGITAGDDSVLSTILVGTPPPAAERLKVSGVDGRTSAYKLGGATYVRTPHTLLSPTWDASVSSADGTNVYKLAEAPVLLLSDNGQMVRAQVQQSAVDPFGLPDDQDAEKSATSDRAAPSERPGDRG